MIGSLCSLDTIYILQPEKRCNTVCTGSIFARQLTDVTDVLSFSVQHIFTFMLALCSTSRTQKRKPCLRNSSAEVSECESARRSDDDEGTGSRAASPAEPSFAGLASLSSCQTTNIGEQTGHVSYW